MPSPSWLEPFRHGHALAGSTLGFTVARSALGISEAGNFPSAHQSRRGMVPKEKSGHSLPVSLTPAPISGPVVAPIVVPLILVAYGWKMAFIATAPWASYGSSSGGPYMISLSRKKNLSQSGIRPYHSDDEDITPITGRQPHPLGHVSWPSGRPGPCIRQIPYRPGWWFYLFWLNGYFHDVFHQNTNKITWPLS